MQIINDSFHGFRQFAAGIIAHGDKLGDWVSCRDLQATRLNLPVVIGGVEIKVADGSDLLRELITAAKAGNLSKEEAEVIASQLDTVSFRFDHRKCMYFCEVVLVENISVDDVPEDVIEVLSEIIDEVVLSSDNTLTDETPSDNITEAVVVTEDSPAEAPKRGRKAKK